MSALAKPKSRRVYHRVHTAAVGGRIRRVKLCPACGRKKVAEDGASDSGFYVHGRHKGKPWFYPHCKECRSRERRERMDADPEFAERTRARERAARERWLTAAPENREKAKVSSRQSYHRRKAKDPEAVREACRMGYVLRQERKGKTVRHHWTVIDGTRPRVPAGRFSRWLVEYKVQRQLPTAVDVAAELGLAERRVRSHLAGDQAEVSVDVVDRALCNAVEPVMLDGQLILRFDDLYPG